MLLPDNFLPEYETAFSQLNDEAHQVIQHWPNALKEQLKLVLTLSQFITDSLSQDHDLVQMLPNMMLENQRCESYREKLSELLKVAMMKIVGLGYCASLGEEKWSI